MTDEYPSTLPDSGGLASYIHRMAHLLVAAGHRVEVFVPSRTARLNLDGGVIVHEVPSAQGLFLRLGHLSRKSWRLSQQQLETVAAELDCAVGISRAVAAREAKAPFDIVQSADYKFRGLFVRSARRPHVVRCSWARDLFQREDGVAHVVPNPALAFLERLAIRRADFAYAPSEYVARYYTDTFGLRVRVIRPAQPAVAPESVALPEFLPGRYLLHFGALCHRKGTDLVVQALPLAWREEPSLNMVLAGVDPSGIAAASCRDYGDRRGQIRWLGALRREQLAPVIRGACASVLPSRCDNLPNTALESLAADVPVIATRDSSIDELVNDQENGLLVPQNDPAALAAAMIRVWRGQVPWTAGSLPRPPIFAQMEPGVAVRALLSLARKSR